MLPKKNRLNLKLDFKSSAQEGKKLQTNNLVIFLSQNKDGKTLVGIAVAKKHFNKAVLRNKAKRIVSAAIQNQFKNLRGGANIVIMPKQGVLLQSVKDIEEEIKNVKDLYPNN